MKQKILIFVGGMALYLTLANCIATGIALNELYSELVEYSDIRRRERKIRKAQKDLHKKAMMAKKTS